MQEGRSKKLASAGDEYLPLICPNPLSICVARFAGFSTTPTHCIRFMQSRVLEVQLEAIFLRRSAYFDHLIRGSSRKACTQDSSTAGVRQPIQPRFPAFAPSVLCVHHPIRRIRGHSTSSSSDFCAGSHITSTSSKTNRRLVYAASARQSHREISFTPKRHELQIGYSRSSEGISLHAKWLVAASLLSFILDSWEAITKPSKSQAPFLRALPSARSNFSRRLGSCF